LWHAARRLTAITITAKPAILSIPQTSIWLPVRYLERRRATSIPSKRIHDGLNSAAETSVATSELPPTCPPIQRKVALRGN
jgi:hypothetical protein